MPGAPSPAGVPVDRRAELEDELAPVFGLLEEPQREAAALVSRAKAEAERRRSIATEQAAGLVAQARADAAAEQSGAAASRLAGGEIERRSLLDAANAEVARIDRAAQERIPTAVAELVGGLLEQPR